jgi:amino acid transporter
MTFCVIGENRRTPWFTIIVVAAVAGGFVFFRSIEDVARYTNFATLLVFAGVNASALRILAVEKGDGWGARVLTNTLLPVVGVVASLWLAASLGWQAALFGAALLASGIVAFLIFKRIRGEPA